MVSNHQHTINSSLEPVLSSKKQITTSPTRLTEDDKAIAMILSRLAIHYYRPDFSEGQAKLLIGDMVEDLREFTPDVVADACSAYRRKVDAKYFPNSGALRAIAADLAKAKREAAKPLKALPESRPACWWLKPRDQWKPHWQESEIPTEHRRTK